MLIWLVVVLCFLTFGSFIGVRVLMSLFALRQLSAYIIEREH